MEPLGRAATIRFARSPQGRVLHMNVCGGLALIPTPLPTCDAHEGVVLCGLIRRGNS